METVKPGVYEHYKGKQYHVICTAKHSETLEDMVVYAALYENEVSTLWVRPVAMFLEDVELEGQMVPRFRFIAESL